MTRPATTLKFADLFAGVGGFHAAIAHSPLLEGQCVYASEIDDACCTVYEQNYGLRPNGDIWPVARSNPGLVPDIDMLCAGFPCQPFSKSGYQRGIEEARGTLFEAILLILQVKRPRYALLENVRNLIGPKHQDTWATILRLMRALGYAVSSEPTLLSPHELPPGLGSPQIRDRVYIPAVYVGRDLAASSIDSLPALIPRPPFPDWHPTDWRAVSYLRDVRDPRADGRQIGPEKVHIIDMWQDFITRLPGRIPRFPIWTDVFLGRLEEDKVHPNWKNILIRKNADFHREHRALIATWSADWGLSDVVPSHRKLEWQAQELARDLWAHTIQFRPSGVRVRPLTYLPALVAMNQTSIIGPLRRTITPLEAGALQGFSPSFLSGRRFIPDSQDARAFRQFGNAVHVGVARLAAESLVMGSGAGGYPIPEEWRAMIRHAELRSHRPEDIVADDAPGW